MDPMYTACIVYAVGGENQGERRFGFSARREGTLLDLPDLDAGQVGVASRGAELDDAVVADRDGPGPQLVPVAGGAAVVALFHFFSVEEDVVDLRIVVLPAIKVDLVGPRGDLVDLDHRAPAG